MKEKTDEVKSEWTYGEKIDGFGKSVGRERERQCWKNV